MREAASRRRGREVLENPIQARRVDGGEHPRGPRRPRPSRAHAQKAAHQQHGREPQPPGPPQDTRSGALPMRVIPAPAGLRGPLRDQRGVGDRKDLSQHGGYARMTRLHEFTDKSLALPPWQTRGDR